jgi:hypothetical protein
MKCYAPNTAPNKNGNYPLVFKKELGKGKAMSVPCGHCNACKIAKANQKAVRVMHEAEMHKHNSFITLTYNDENLPLLPANVPTLSTAHVQNFFKRYRRAGFKISYFAGGEYGEAFGRPHYHVAVFGHKFTDGARLLRPPTRKNPFPKQLYTSPDLSNLWGKGYVSTGELTFASAAYIARYCQKKAYGSEGKRANNYFYDAVLDEKIDYDVGLEIYGHVPDVYKIERQPERQWQSLKPAIGLRWLLEYYSDISDDGFISVRKIEKGERKYYPMRVPKYYLDTLGKQNQCTKMYAKYIAIREHTLEYVEKHPDDVLGEHREATLNTRQTLANRRAVELPRNVEITELRAIA